MFADSFRVALAATLDWAQKLCGFLGSWPRATPLDGLRRLCRIARTLGFQLVVLASLAAPAVAQETQTLPDVDPGWFPQQIQMAVGEQKVLSSEGVRSYSEGTRGIVDVRLTRDAKSFVVVGVQPGTTTLLFILNDRSERHIRITVTDPEESRGKVQEETIVVEARDNVRLDFYFVQLEKSGGYRVGVDPADALTVGAGVSFDFLQNQFQGASAVVEDQALLRLDLAQAAGWAKLMRKAAVITENGKKASFSGGGEVNIPVQGSLSTGIHAISFGSSIEVLPRYDAESGRLEIELHADVSDLTDDRGSGTPGRTTSELSTIVNLRLGEALVLGGLTARSEMHSRSGLFGLSQIPVLGVLFGTTANSQQETENVVFIVPTVVDAVRDDATDHIESALQAYEAYSGDREELRGLRKSPAGSARKGSSR